MPRDRKALLAAIAAEPGKRIHCLYELRSILERERQEHAERLRNNDTGEFSSTNWDNLKAQYGMLSSMNWRVLARYGKFRINWADLLAEYSEQSLENYDNCSLSDYHEFSSNNLDMLLAGIDELTIDLELSHYREFYGITGEVSINRKELLAHYGKLGRQRGDLLADFGEVSINWDGLLADYGIIPSRARAAATTNVGNTKETVKGGDKYDKNDESRAGEAKAPIGRGQILRLGFAYNAKTQVADWGDNEAAEANGAGAGADSHLATPSQQLHTEQRIFAFTAVPVSLPAPESAGQKRPADAFAPAPPATKRTALVHTPDL